MERQEGNKAMTRHITGTRDHRVRAVRIIERGDEEIDFLHLAFLGMDVVFLEFQSSERLTHVLRGP